VEELNEVIRTRRANIALVPLVLVIRVLLAAPPFLLLVHREPDVERVVQGP
jgi:hypothetical protein